MKKNTIFIYLLIAFFALTPAFSAYAQIGGGCNTITGIRQPNFNCLVGFIAGAINQLVVLLIGVGLLLFIWGLVKYVSAGGDEDEVKKAKRFIVFGLIAFFVMLSVWGLVNLLVNTVWPTGGGNLRGPQFR